MRFLHLSDLHLGKRVCEFSMLDDQRYILEQILSLLDSRHVDAVLLAGDLYDKPALPPPGRSACWTGSSANFPPGAAGLRHLSGNHDSADRVAFGSACWRPKAGSARRQCFPGRRSHHPHRRTRPRSRSVPALFEARYGAAMSGRTRPVESFNDALACVLDHCSPDPARRSVLVAHSSWQELPPARARSPAWAASTGWMPPCSTSSTMWRWGICTAQRRWAGTPLRATAERPLIFFLEASQLEA